MANTNAKVIVGAGLAGLAAGLLFAPKSGKEVRQDMKKKVQELSDQANQKMEAGKDKAKDLKQQAVEQAKKVRSAIKKSDAANDIDTTMDEPLSAM